MDQCESGGGIDSLRSLKPDLWMSTPERGSFQVSFQRNGSLLSSGVFMAEKFVSDSRWSLSLTWPPILKKAACMVPFVCPPWKNERYLASQLQLADSSFSFSKPSLFSWLAKSSCLDLNEECSALTNQGSVFEGAHFVSWVAFEAT